MIAGITMQRGFLPKKDPLQRLPKAFEVWEEIAHDMPKRLAAGTLRNTLDKLALLDAAYLQEDQYDRAMLLLSYFGHGYIWESWRDKPPNHLPKGVAVPWVLVSKKLGRPPVLSYASYALHNWRRLDPKGPIALGNICLLQNFLGGVDEEWFILVHVDIEAKAGEGLAAISLVQEALKKDNPRELTAGLKKMTASLKKMNQTLLRMTESCDPYIYYNRVRPYIHGWKDNPALPDGVYYEGVKEFEGRAQKFRGETGAQSTIIPCFDACLGITHSNDRLKNYLNEMRDYMPPRHRRFLETIEKGPNLRDYVLGKKEAKLRTLYNQCVALVEKFRSTHLDYAKSYVASQVQKSQGNPTEVGTGGTPFISYLKKHRDETKEHKL